MYILYTYIQQTISVIYIYIYILSGRKEFIETSTEQTIYIYIWIVCLFQFISSYLPDNDLGFKVIDRDENED